LATRRTFYFPFFPFPLFIPFFLYSQLASASHLSSFTLGRKEVGRAALHYFSQGYNVWFIFVWGHFLYIFVWVHKNPFFSFVFCIVFVLCFGSCYLRVRLMGDFVLQKKFGFRVSAGNRLGWAHRIGVCVAKGLARPNISFHSLSLVPRGGRRLDWSVRAARDIFGSFFLSSFFPFCLLCIVRCGGAFSAKGEGGASEMLLHRVVLRGWSYIHIWRGDGVYHWRAFGFHTERSRKCLSSVMHKSKNTKKKSEIGLGRNKAREMGLAVEKRAALKKRALSGVYVYKSGKNTRDVLFLGGISWLRRGKKNGLEVVTHWGWISV
jgi:hypothetical protein